MMSQTPDLEAVVKRLERLENRLEKHKNETDETRFWGRWGPLIYLLIGAALPIGFGVGNTMRSLGQGDQRVKTEEFLLKDTAGRLRGKLVVGDNLPQLTLYDSHGRPGAPLVTEPALSQTANGATQAEPRQARKAQIEKADDGKLIAYSANPILEGGESVIGRLTNPEARRELIAATRKLASAVLPWSDPANGAATPVDSSTANVRRRVSHPERTVVAQLTRDPFAYGTQQRVMRRAALVPPSVAPGAVPAATPLAAPSPRPAPSPDVPGAPSALPVLASALPPVKLTVLGYVDKPGVGREVAVSDNFEVYVTHEGETFAERFKVLKITPTLVEVFDTYTNQTLRLGVSP